MISLFHFLFILISYSKINKLSFFSFLTPFRYATLREKREGNIQQRSETNQLITLTDCRIPESDRLQKCDSFKDTAKVLQMTRAGVAWQAVGCARGAYEAALKYTKKREQFGKPIASFQLVQNHLVEMVANLTAMQTMCFRLSELQDEGLLTDEHASLAKVFCSMRTRDVVSQAREVMGGNGILLEYDVARFVADAEAIYSYEGTKEINTLIYSLHLGVNATRTKTPTRAKG